MCAITSPASNAFAPAGPGQMRKQSHKPTYNPIRRGIVAVLAMIFLALFATLALGFYAATTANAVVAQNEKNGTISLTAAESGMDFLRYQLSLIKVPAT